jgi:hypothetical protein
MLNKFTFFYGTRMIITVFTIARHFYLQWTKRIQKIALHSYLISILISSSHLRLNIESYLISLNSVLISYFSLSCYMNCQSYCPLFNRQCLAKSTNYEVIIVRFLSHFNHFLSLTSLYLQHFLQEHRQFNFFLTSETTFHTHAKLGFCMF